MIKRDKIDSNVTMFTCSAIIQSFVTKHNKYLSFRSAFQNKVTF